MLRLSAAVAGQSDKVNEDALVLLESVMVMDCMDGEDSGVIVMVTRSLDAVGEMSRAWDDR